MEAILVCVAACLAAGVAGGFAGIFFADHWSDVSRYFAPTLIWGFAIGLLGAAFTTPSVVQLWKIRFWPVIVAGGGTTFLAASLGTWWFMMVAYSG
jgi:hypothetical protein